MARSTSGESVLSRAVRIFDAFGPGSPALTLTEISRRAALPIATASRLVEELTRHGMLSRDEHRRVRIGTRMWELAERASPMRDLRRTALPFMGDLQAVVGQSTQLGVLDGDEVLFVERLSAPGSVVNFTEIAGRLPLHASSSGQVLLACAPAEVKERVLARPLRVYTPRTVHDERSLRATLADVRARGFAFCPGHIHPDATGLAVPIRSGGQVIASLSLVVPNDENAWSLLRPLQVTAMALGRTLSAPPPVTR